MAGVPANPARRSAVALAAGVLIGLAIGFNSHVLAARATLSGLLPAADEERLAQVLEHVRHDYVDGIDEHRLMDGALKGMVGVLDEHSAVLSADDYADFKVATGGAYAGVGIEVTASDGLIRIVDTIPGSPAARAGVKAGEELLAVDGAPVDAAHLTQGLTRLRGAPGTRVELALRRGDGSGYALRLERCELHLSTVVSHVLTPGIAYLRISQFADSTPDELETAVGHLRAAAGGAPLALVLDLRDNPGGVLEAGIAVADAFLDSGLIVRAEGRAEGANFERHAQPGDILDGGPIAVLINARSASSAEIVAAALQDNHRATVLGQASFGKGSVQSLIPLDGGRALKLTTSRYYTPSGRSLAGRGLSPDVELPVAPAHAALAEDSEVAAAVAALSGTHSRSLAGL
jgi:carboxyl-terminal processing protease